MPMRRMLFRESTPSILDRSWLTMLSLVPVLSPVDPRALHIESNSSQMITWSCELSPCCLYSFSASAKRFLMFSSDCPTYLFIISGPLTILGSAAFRNLASCLAIRVLPVPGGPYSSMPRTWLMPRSRTMWGGKTREANARRKIFPNSFDRPPMPSSSKLKSGRKMLRCWTLSLMTCSFPDEPWVNSISVDASNMPWTILPGASPEPRSRPAMPNTTILRVLAWWSKAMGCPVHKT
mmetsp:Transcript_63968/g.166317  ORF Transcript_63968/g.166317 Transcript_63968/m.166317 type:complete len:236 (-) Transcript_63968:358-1065(-)